MVFGSPGGGGGCGGLVWAGSGGALSCNGGGSGEFTFGIDFFLPDFFWMDSSFLSTAFFPLVCSSLSLYCIDRTSLRGVIG